MGLFCIRIEIGRKIFVCLGDKVAVFFEFAKKGAAFVYGDDLVYGNENLLSVFAFSVSIIRLFFYHLIYGSSTWTMSVSNDFNWSLY